MEQTASVAAETGRVKAIQDKHAGGYDRQIAFFERILFGDGRAWVCSQAHGRVLELAAGTVRNLPFYPAEIELTAIELSPEMLAIGRDRAANLRHPVDLRLGDAQALEFDDESFDTVTCTLGFCTIPDTTTAAREAFQVGLLRHIEPLVEDPVTRARGYRVAQLQAEARCTQAVRPDLGVLTVAALRSSGPLRLERLVDRAMGVDPAALGIGYHGERLVPAILAADASSEPEQQ